MKKKICISGNCVTKVIPHFLRTNEDFNAAYEIEDLKPIFMIKKEDLEPFKAVVSSCDIFLTQPIGGQKYVEMGIDTESIKKIMKPGTELFSIPVPYFIGYFPEQFYLHDSTAALVGVCEGLPSPYHNKIIFWGYLNGKSVEDTLDLLYAPKTLKNISQLTADSLAELRRREKNLSFKISDFLESQYMRKRLFWTINHPANALIQYMSSEILKILEIQSIVKEIAQEFLAGYVTPILPSVANELHLQLQPNSEIRETTYTLDFIKKTYHYYDEHPKLIELNKDVVKDLI